MASEDNDRQYYNIHFIVLPTLCMRLVSHKPKMCIVDKKLIIIFKAIFINHFKNTMAEFL